MELFHDVNIDWLGKKWYFLGFSLIFSVAGIISMGMHWHKIGSPIPLGVDFKGGTQLELQFKQTPDIARMRTAMAEAGIKDVQIVRYDDPSKNEVLISLPEQHNEANLDTGREEVFNALQQHYETPVVRNTQVVGPTVGKQLQNKAIQATLYSMVGMLIYL